MQFLQDYLQNLQNISPNDKEHTHRTYLQIFLESMCQILSTQNKTLESIRIIHEPKNDKEGRGAPDFLIQRQGLNIGYIENKRVNYDLDSLAQDPQIQKYMRLSKNIMLTDYLRFALLCQDDKGNTAITQEVRICELSQIKSTLKNNTLLESKAKELAQLFILFFTHEPKSINTALEFANALALRTQILKDELIANATHTHIASVYHTFQKELYENLEFNEFADSFAQTLTYSLFLARLNNTTTKDIDLYNVKPFIPRSFPLIRALSDFLSNLDELDSIKWLISEILYITNHIDIASIISELNRASQKDLYGRDTLHFTHKDPYLHFYETFLSQYDPHLREVRGVYYTPASVVHFIINAIDLSLQTDFNLKGLRAALDYDENNPKSKPLKLLDFATGTGTFLLESYRKALESTPKNSPYYEPNKLLKQFFGFEFLIAPYTIAHLKLSQSFKEEFDTPLNDDERLGIYLTNTLYFKASKDEQNEKSNLFTLFPELSAESRAAQATKENEILIITGNPPYSGASSNKGLHDEQVRITYGLEPSLAELTDSESKAIENYFKDPAKYTKEFKAILERHKLQNEKSTKWLLDDYVKFIRFAESKIQKQGSGIFAFISNNSFLDNPTFRGMRYHLLRTFDKLYILDLHGNARKKETTPSGEKDDNVFDIMQGVSINIFIKSGNSVIASERGNPQSNKFSHCETSAGSRGNPQSPESKRDCHGDKSPRNDKSQNLAKIYHYDVYGKRKDKYNFLYENTLDSIPWQELKPQNPFYLFIPQNESLRAEYDTGWSVKDIFRVSSTGICSQRDSVVIHKTKQSIETLIKDFCNMSKDEIVKKYNIQKDGRDWQIQRAINSVKKSEQNKTGVITRIHYKPFDYHWTYFNGESRAFMAYPRTDVMQHFLHDFENPALIYNRSVALSSYQHALATNMLTDLHILETANASAYISPLYIKDSVIASEGKPERGNPQSSKFSHCETSAGSRGNPKAKNKLDCHADKSARNDKHHDSGAESYSNPQWTENFTKEFRAFIDSKYGEHFSPEQILGYIYAVLFHKDYREKYIDFLKIDFPKIPFTESKETFLALSALGFELLQTHLLQDSTSGYERERERERTGANENESQYWASSVQTDSKQGIYPRIYSAHHNGELLYFKHNKRDKLSLPPLSLQGGLMKNVALICDRGSKLSYIDNIFIADSIIDLHVVGSGSYAFPLYIKE